ncbi:MAG: ERCC4 domain-containing protein [Candidatus Pacearchaeota archaeon]
MAFYDIFSKQTEKYDEKITEKPLIIIDYREKNSLVASELIHLGCRIEFKNLKIGDYIVKDTIIERKTVSDFLNSMINKRLINQIKNMQQFRNKLLIIEGVEEQDIYTLNKINENAIRGFLLSIILKYQVPIIFTNNCEDTSKFITVLAKKQEKGQETSMNNKPHVKDKKEQLQYIIEGFPGIGPKTAKKLLNEYKTIKNIINTPIENLNVLIGKKAEVFELVNKEYR